ncbi:MAG: lipopolysaccharide assembly protein LapA domain-containing protein [Cyanobacteria bacterium P01_A01_bin.45]
MKQLNFLIIFIFCLGLALFAIQNSEPVIIHILPNLDASAPMAIDLILTIGIGATSAWVFNLWTQLQREFILNQTVHQKNIQIQELESKIEEYKTEIQSLKLSLPPVGKTLTNVATG